jgi:hypothetical protein
MNLLTRQSDAPAAAEMSHGAHARSPAAPLNAMGDNVTIQKNWQEQELAGTDQAEQAPGDTGA